LDCERDIEKERVNLKVELRTERDIEKERVNLKVELRTG